MESGDYYEHFTQKNAISCVTLRLRQPTQERKQERLFGEEPHGIDDDPEAAICGHVRRFSAHPLGLVVFDSHIEQEMGFAVLH